VIVLDSSVILAILFQERGASLLNRSILDESAVSTVNLAEVQTKMIRLGHDPEEAWRDAISIGSQILPYTQEQAKLAGTLTSQTQHMGLSLGGRSCLALGILLGVPVYTAERVWSSLKLGIPIHVIR
jgi:ribonuclease VapC